MKNLDKNVKVTHTSNASKMSENYFYEELNADAELAEMVSKVLNSISEFKSSYAKKERALKITNELLFLKVTTSRQK
jgi:hypothetical protein